MSHLTSYTDYYKAKSHALRQNPLLKSALESFLEKKPKDKNISLLSETLDCLNKVFTDKYTPTDVNQALILLHNIVFEIKDKALHKHLTNDLLSGQDDKTGGTASAKLKKWLLDLEHSTNQCVLRYLEDKNYLDLQTAINDLNTELETRKRHLNCLPTPAQLDIFKQEELATLEKKEKTLTDIIQQQEIKLTTSSGNTQKEKYSVESFKTAVALEQPDIIAEPSYWPTRDAINAVNDIKNHLGLVNKQLCQAIVEAFKLEPHEQSNPSYKLWREIYDSINNNLYVSHYQLLTDGFSAYVDDAKSATTLVFNELSEFYPGKAMQPQTWLDQHYYNGGFTSISNKAEEILKPLFQRETLINKLDDKIAERETALECHAAQTQTDVKNINSSINRSNALMAQIGINNHLIGITNDYKSRYDELQRLSQLPWHELVAEKFNATKNLLSYVADYDPPLYHKASKKLQQQFSASQKQLSQKQDEAIKLINETLVGELAKWMQNIPNMQDVTKEKFQGLDDICNFLDDWHTAIPQRYKSELEQCLKDEIPKYYKNFVCPIVEQNITFLESCIKFITSETGKKSVYCNQTAQDILQDAKETFEAIKVNYKEVLNLPEKQENAKTLPQKIRTIEQLNQYITHYCDLKINDLKKNRSLARNVVDSIRTFFRHIARFFDPHQHVKIQPQSRYDQTEYVLLSTQRFFKPRNQEKTQKIKMPVYGASRRLN